MLRVAVAVVGLVAALAACGGDYESGPDPETIGKGEYVRRADVICTDIRRRLRPLVKARAKTPAEAARNATGRGNLYEEKLVLLRDIDQPDRDADALDRYLDDVQALAVQERKVTAGAVTGRADLMRRIEKDHDEAAERETASARAFGFRVCGLERVAR